MSPFESFREYIALKSHFTTKSYDYFRYNGKTKSASTKAYEARKDKLFFMKLAKHSDPKGFLVSNFIDGDNKWIGNLAYNEQAQTIYTNWIKRTQSLTYNFQSELSKLKDNFDENILIEDNSHPHLIKLLLRKEISIETLIMLVDVARCFTYWNKHLENDPVWEEVSFKIKKYRPFIQYDKQKIKDNILDKFS
jgi:hypothetical protein